MTPYKLSNSTASLSYSASYPSAQQNIEMDDSISSLVLSELVDNMALNEKAGKLKTQSSCPK